MKTYPGTTIVANALLLSLALAPIARSQILPDNSLPNNSQVTPNGSVFQIDGGTAAGTNLFHSLQEFGVPTGHEAFFNNATTINNIITRVTGGNLSNIDGLIRANGTANLFLINPNGIVFGPNARLDIGGSFFASTAESVVFGDNVEFSASQPAANPLLTINVPIGVQMGANPNPITVQGNGHNLTLEIFSFDLIQSDRNVGLQVNDGSTLALVGGDILLEGGNLTANQGRIELGSVAGAGTVSLISAPEGFSLEYGEIASFGNLSLTQASSIDASGAGSGNIHLQGGNISVVDSSAVLNNTLGASNGGQTAIEAADTLVVDGGGFVIGIINETIGSGNGGDVNIAARNVQVINAAIISTVTQGDGDGGDINLTVTETLAANANLAFSLTGISANTNGNGNGGDVNIAAQNVQLANFGTITTQSLGEGDGGDINLSVAGNLTLDNVSFLSSDTFHNGNGGEINIAAQNVQVTNSAGIFASRSTSTRATIPPSAGDGGDIALTVAETLTIDGLSFISTSTSADGRGGNTTVTAQNLQVTNGGEITASASGNGAAGTIDLTVADTLIVDGEGSFTSPFTGVTLSGFSEITSEAGIDFRGDPVPGAMGNGGNVNVTARNIQLSNGASISGTTGGAGNAGTIDFAATETIEIDAASVTSSVTSEATGNGGVLRLQAPQIALGNSASIDTSTDGAGNAGSIALQASDLLQLSDGSRITSSSNSTATGLGGSTNIQGGLLQISDSQIEAASDSFAAAGSVTIDVREVNLVENATISVSGNNMGDAGNLLINANTINLDGRSSLQGTVTAGSQGDINLTSSSLVLRDNSNITTNAGEQANGGNITIDTASLVLLEDSDITANALEGQGGNILITTEGMFVSPDSSITASSQFGIDGMVQINNPDVDSTQVVVELSQTPLDPSALIVAACSSAVENSLVITGRGGLPPSPSQQLISNRPWRDLRDLSAFQGESADNLPQANVPRKLVEANALMVHPDGGIELVALAANTQLMQLPFNCASRQLVRSSTTP